MATMTTMDEQTPLINPNRTLQSYYASLESRIGYRLLLGGTRHFGYYSVDTYWPFPISRALRAMEDQLYDTLGLGTGAQVLDAGCGVGHVAMHLAQKGLHIQGIDVVERSVQKAQKYVKAAGLEGSVAVQMMDYHHLNAFSDETFDGAYTMETFVHATDPQEVLAGFHRVLKPGGTLALFEYENGTLNSAPSSLRESFRQIDKYSAMPAHAQFEDGVLEGMLSKAGFVDVRVKDLTTNVTPMLRFFFILAYIPYLIITFFGLQAWFVNTVAGVEGYRARHYCRYVAVSAKKGSSTSADLGDVRNRMKG